jgi:hypothetical protein
MTPRDPSPVDEIWHSVAAINAPLTAPKACCTIGRKAPPLLSPAGMSTAAAGRETTARSRRLTAPSREGFPPADQMHIGGWTIVGYQTEMLHPVGFIEPCLPTSARSVPSGPQWAYEIKHDGFTR